MADAQKVKNSFLSGFRRKKKSGGNDGFVVPTVMPSSSAAAPSGFAIGFKEGLIGGAVLFALMAGWMFLRSSDTAYKIQDLLPSKAASIEDPNAAPSAPAEEEQTAAPQSTETEQTEQPAVQERPDGPKSLTALSAAPLEGLSQDHNGKMLPISRIQDDMTPFQAYKKPFEAVAGRALVSIVIVDFGLSESLSNTALEKLPADITLVLNPYADDPAKWASSSRSKGHEFWLSLPMQTKEFGTGDTGPNTLLLNASKEENEARLFNVMGTAAGYAGIVSQEGHVFTQDIPSAEPIQKQIFGRGLGFVESNPDAAAFGIKSATDNGYPYAQNTLWLDSDLRPDAIDRALKDLEAQATKKGKAIAFVHPYPAVMTKLESWLKDAESKGLQIAPLSAMVQ